ncbi:hypothetical protein KCM76_22795 [Zooshikella marina]|uniref:hypothetical protein n=1 Tax=Zooshikella ganghwensis TaxID=202772 RepID=UPI001BB036B2|nr:hypothetical protein [Zooshikella ganghwensis]MBU2708840.1 hypothetical protein [Zooshikella ganghwensis]
MRKIELEVTAYQGKSGFWLGCIEGLEVTAPMLTEDQAICFAKITLKGGGFSVLLEKMQSTFEKWCLGEDINIDEIDGARLRLEILKNITWINEAYKNLCRFYYEE